MNRSQSLLLIIFICLGCTKLTHYKEIDPVIAAMIKPGGAGCTVAVANGDRILFSKGYGSADPEYDIPNTRNTIFHVASVSKQFTAFAIALLADQGKVSLNDDIRKYIPELHDFGQKITINHLIHHTSGLRDQWNLLALAVWRLDDVITRKQVLRLMSHQEELNFKPGEKFSYCNTGYTLLAEIVSRVSGKSFPEWCSENIFIPLQMEHTLFYDDHEKIVKNRAYSFHDSPDGLKKSVLSYAVAGATSLFTTAEDLTKWSDNFQTMKVGNPGVMKQMEERGILNNGDTLSYAFGQSISRYRGLKAISHSGGDAGYRSFLLRFPEQKYSIAVLSNDASFIPGQLAYQIADVYLKEYLKAPEKKEEEKREPEETNTAPFDARAVDLQAYAGTFYSPELETFYTLSVEDDTLEANHIRLDPAKMLTVSTDKFSTDEWFMSNIDFTRDGKGEINGFQVSSGRVENVKFTKKKM
jgi:CubicO group peptidase (beta-lactamase class C family)